MRGPNRTNVVPHVDVSSQQEPAPHQMGVWRDEVWAQSQLSGGAAQGYGQQTAPTSGQEYEHRASSGSPGKESVQTFGEGERGVLSSVIARLQHGIELAGDPGSYSRKEAPPSDLDRLRDRLSNPFSDHAGAASMKELRGQLDRAGIVIAQQLETSARKDILMEEQECRCKLEKITWHMQLERMYDILTEERADRCATEEALMEQVNQLHATKESLLAEGKKESSEAQQTLAFATQSYEDRLAAMSEAHKETLAEAVRRQDEIRRESREELQEAAARQSEVIAEAEHQRRIDKEEADATAELLLAQIEELEARLEVYDQATEVVFEAALDAGAEAVSKVTAEKALHMGQQGSQMEEMQQEHEEVLVTEVGRHQQYLEHLSEELEASQLREKKLQEAYQKLMNVSSEEKETARLHLESELREQMTDIQRLHSRGDHVVEELIETQQELGRYHIMYTQLQELVAFFLTRYAPHLMEDRSDEDLLGQHPGTKHTSVYPSYWGWMFRSRGMFVSWQRRFFVLRDGLLRFGTSDANATQPLLNMESVAKVELESFNDVAQGNHPPTGKYESFGFMIETYSKQKVRFCCTSSSERAEWMKVLRECIDIRLSLERARAYSPDHPVEPYLYLEDCSPPDPPPSYRTRVRLADSGAYPMLGPGSPPRSRLPVVFPVHLPVTPPTERTPASPRLGNPPRPTLLSNTGVAKGTTMAPHRAGPGQLGGASGVGANHGPTKRNRRAMAQAAATSGTKRTVPPFTATSLPKPLSSTPSRRGSRPGTSLTSEVTGDAFEGTVPLDVLLVKASASQAPEHQAKLTRSTAHAFSAKFRESYDKTQIFYASGPAAAAASAIYTDVLHTDTPTLLQGMSNGDTSVLKLLNNMAAQPSVPGAPSSLLIVLIGPDHAIDQLASALEAEGENEEPLPEQGAALYSSLCAAHRNGVSWSFVARMDNCEGDSDVDGLVLQY